MYQGEMDMNKIRAIKEMVKELSFAPDTHTRTEIKHQIYQDLDNLEADIDNILCGSKDLFESSMKLLD